MGIITVYLSEKLKNKTIKEMAIGIIFPLLFSISITLFQICKQCHLILIQYFGELAFTPLIDFILILDLGPKAIIFHHLY